MLLTHTNTHPFNVPLSGTTRVSRYQKGKTNLDFIEARDSEWQWHCLIGRDRLVLLVVLSLVIMHSCSCLLLCLLLEIFH